MTRIFCLVAEPRQNPNGLGNLLSQIVIGTTGTRPDFNVEEKASIEKDTRELRQIIREMGDYLPREDPEKGKNDWTIQFRRVKALAFHLLSQVWNHSGNSHFTTFLEVKPWDTYLDVARFARKYDRDSE